ncbi:MAG: vitamin K epoxide reductase family protein [Hormoscilla sp.]
MRRKRSSPWIHRQSRFIIAIVATLGAVTTAYLTAVTFAGESAACPTEGCDKVLSSPYAIVFGLPLALFGLLAYASMAGMAVSPWLLNPDSQKELRSQLENWTWLLMFAGGTSMALFSGYLMYVMAFEIKSLCLYCIFSAVCSVSLAILAFIGRDWKDIGQVFFIGVIVGMITLVGTLAVYAPINNPRAEQGGGYAITTTSTPAKIALAKHLKAAGFKMYGAFWCSHCQDQKTLFGKEAAAELNYIECDPNGKNPQMALCRTAGVPSYPTWEVKGQLYPGVQGLEQLAELSGYTGDRNF